MKKAIIYMIGVISLGISYSLVRKALSNDAIFAGLALVYLLILRLLAERFGKT